MKALIVVDIQNDFLPGGALAVAHSDEMIPVINRMLAQPFDVKVATKDWHPKEHASFAENHKGKKIGDIISWNGVEQILWPVHCVQGSEGSQFAKTLKANLIQHVVYKGIEKDIDSYSTFWDNGHQRSTGLNEFLLEHGIKEVFIAGLTTDYCVKYSALDAQNHGFNTYVIKDGCCAVNLNPSDEDRALDQMARAGIHIVDSKGVLKIIAS